MRSKRPSSGDRALLDELKKRGCTASSPQIERWRYWRRVGFVPRPIRHGKGRGSSSEYADLAAVADRVCEAEPLVRRYHDLDFAALVLCARGRPIDPHAVKDAILDVFSRLDGDFRARAQPQHGEDPTEVAYNAARALARSLTRGRRARERRQAGYRPPEHLLQAAAIAARFLAGEPQLDDRDFELLLTESGLARLLALMGLSTTDAVHAMKGIAAHANFPAIGRILETATAPAIVEALRDAHRLVVAFVPADFGVRWSIDREALAVYAAPGLLFARTNAATPAAAEDTAVP
jgi:hypothetical protein